MDNRPTEGWISLHRKMLEWEWYTDANVCRIFIHCLLKANHKTKKWRGVTIKRGTFITSIKNLSHETGLSNQQVRTALQKLTDSGEINKQTTSLNTLITVTKYDEYQNSNKAITNNQHTSQQDSNKRVTTTNNDNNENKSRDTLSPLISEYASVCSMEQPLTVEQGDKLVEEFGEIEVNRILSNMENYKPLVKKNKSAYLTARNWLSKDKGQQAQKDNTGFHKHATIRKAQ